MKGRKLAIMNFNSGHLEIKLLKMNITSFTPSATHFRFLVPDLHFLRQAVSSSSSFHVF